MRTFPAVLASALCLVSGVANAQSFNVDIGMNLTIFAPTPSDAYGAAAAQDGHWNGYFPSFTPVALDDLSGATSMVTLRSDATSTFNVFPGVMVPGDDQRLMEDFHITPNLNMASTWTFEGLADGSYSLYSYASDPTSSSVITEIAVPGSASAAQPVGAGWPGAHGLGLTFARHDIDVVGGTLEMTATVVGGQLDSGVLNGLQLVFNGGFGTNYCAANANSTGGTSSISGAGSTQVASNNAILTADGLPSNAFGFFLVSQTPGFAMNPAGSEGNLCLGGSIGRYVGAGQIQNSGGNGSFSLALDLTMTPQPLGFVAIAPGETWFFQAWHRDLVAGTVTSNFTDGLEVDFQ